VANSPGPKRPAPQPRPNPKLDNYIKKSEVPHSHPQKFTTHHGK
jgi:hypothetical protein